MSSAPKRSTFNVQLSTYEAALKVERWKLNVESSPVARPLHRSAPAGAVFALLLALCFLAPFSSALGASRIKDLAMVAGARDNQLVGYGLVSGIAGDGDKNPIYTLQT